MSDLAELPEVRPSDCGHGLLPIDTPPAARMQNGQHEQAVYLCDDCRTRLHAPRVEMKGADQPPFRVAVPGDPTATPYEWGAAAARGGLDEDSCPYTDRRTKDAREWLRGFREAESDGKSTGGA